MAHHFLSFRGKPHPRFLTRLPKGLTIIQLMLILFIAGVAGSVIVDIIIDKLCEAVSSKQICTNR